jgi:hypothetical protein
VAKPAAGSRQRVPSSQPPLGARIGGSAVLRADGTETKAPLRVGTKDKRHKGKRQRQSWERKCRCRCPALGGGAAGGDATDRKPRVSLLAMRGGGAYFLLPGCW